MNNIHKIKQRLNATLKRIKKLKKESEEFKKAVRLIGEYSGTKRINKKEAAKLRWAFETVEKRLRWKFPKVEEEYEHDL